MAIVVIGKISLAFATDGAGPMFEPDAQVLTFSLPLTVVAGGNAPTTSQITTAIQAAATSVAGTFNLAVNNAIVEGWAAGNP